MTERTHLAVQQLERPTDLAPEPNQQAIHPSARPAASRPASHHPDAAKQQKVSDLLFRSTAVAPLWLLVRVWLGYEWFTAGWQKLHATGPAAWFGDAPALRGFVRGADAIWANRAQAFGHPAVHYAWFLNFLDFVGDHASIMGPVVVFSEILIGVGLITGVLTRWAALGAVMLNLLYICSGSAGPNGVFIVPASSSSAPGASPGTSAAIASSPTCSPDAATKFVINRERRAWGFERRPPCISATIRLSRERQTRGPAPAPRRPTLSVDTLLRRWRNLPRMDTEKVS